MQPAVLANSSWYSFSGAIVLGSSVTAESDIPFRKLKAFPLANISLNCCTASRLFSTSSSVLGCHSAMRSAGCERFQICLEISRYRSSRMLPLMLHTEFQDNPVKQLSVRRSRKRSRNSRSCRRRLQVRRNCSVSANITATHTHTPKKIEGCQMRDLRGSGGRALQEPSSTQECLLVGLEEASRRFD